MKKALTLLLSLSVCSFGLIAEPEPETPTRDKSMGEKFREKMEKRKGHGGPHGHDPMQHMQRMLGHLQLDESQREIAKGLMEESSVKRKEYQSQMESLVAEMNELRETDSTDENRLIEIGGELGKLKVRAGLLMKHFFEDLKTHLSEEQLNKYNDMKERMKLIAERMKKGRGEGGFRPGGPGGPGMEGRKFPGRKGGPEGSKRHKDGPKEPTSENKDKAEL